MTLKAASSGSVARFQQDPPPAVGAVAPAPAHGYPTFDLCELIVAAAPDARGGGGIGRLREVLRPLARQANKDPQARRELLHLIGDSISRIDGMLSRQINKIIHHPRFQKLESSWRGLRYLVEQSDPGENIQVRLLSVSWAELARDVEKSLEFDGNALFQKIYEDEFGMPGGEPFGLLIGDYEIRHKITADHPIDDVATLASISQVATAAFAPFITSAHPSLLGLTSFGELERPLDLSRAYESPEFIRWRSFRATEEARFVGLTLPRVLMRLPYHEDQAGDRTPFAFHEDVDAPAAADYLWGNAAYAFGAVVVRAFAQSHWLSDIRGVRRGEEGGGIVVGLPVQSFATDEEGVALKFSTDVVITDLLDRTFGDLGLIPLCPCKDTEYSAFYGNRSVQDVKIYSDKAASVNARISGMLQYILCASRIAHYVKVMGRDEIGSFVEANELRNRLSQWLNKFTVDDANATPEVKARFPLRAAEVNVREQLAKPGTYYCELLLSPHSQSDELAMGIKLSTELFAAKT